MVSWKTKFETNLQPCATDTGAQQHGKGHSHVTVMGINRFRLIAQKQFKCYMQ